MVFAESGFELLDDTDEEYERILGSIVLEILVKIPASIRKGG
jgi:hypothetical protein